MIRTPPGTAGVNAAGASPVPSRTEAAELHLIVRIGTERFALPVAFVDEAIDAPEISWVPRAREGLLGELLYRDRTVSAYDAGWAFGVPRTTEAGTALVLRDGDARVAVVVDDVIDLLRVEQQSIRPVPPGPAADGLLRAICLLGETGRELLGLVRVEALLSRVGGRESVGSGRPR